MFKLYTLNFTKEEIEDILVALKTTHSFTQYWTKALIAKLEATIAIR